METKRNGEATEGEAELVLQLGDSLELVKRNGTKLVRCKCGFEFGPASRNWKERALKYVARPQKYGRYVKLHRDLELREYLCPACGILHSVELSRKEDPPLWEVEIRE